MDKKEKGRSTLKGKIFFALWAILILAGIIAKRIYGHPDMVVGFHLPAAVCLVIAWRELSWKVRKKYAESVAIYK